jgi:microcystin degradation protein MlrC
MDEHSNLMPKRVALLGLMLESNRLAPTTTRDDFLACLYLAGAEIAPELDKSETAVMSEMLGFAQDMSTATNWQPVPILVGRVEAGGPIDHAFYRDTIEAMRSRLQAALPLDGVYIANHGAMITTEIDDPDGEMFAMVREVVGASVPIVVTLDLHANISARMMHEADLIIGYRTNPHVDMIPRGKEAAAFLRRLWSGAPSRTAFVRVPLVGPTVTLLTESGPYADLMHDAEAALGGDTLSVSLFPGFAYGDTPKNGMTIMATCAGTDPAPAIALVDRLAQRAWYERTRYQPRLTSLADATERCWRTMHDAALPPVILADVADNPGGGGKGNTTAILRHLIERGIAGALVGVLHDPALVRDAIACGIDRRFDALFNRESDDPEAGRLTVGARVERIVDGTCVGRRGIYQGRRMDLGPTVLLDVDGIKVVVGTIRLQCADPVFFEMVGLDLAKARVVAVKSRGHFRSGFDEFFGADQVIEVDGPGLCSPVLSRFDFKRMQRPIYPLDPDATWTASIDVIEQRSQ